MKKAILLVFAALMLSRVCAQNSVDIYFFWGDGCDHCAAEKPFLESLANQYPEINLKSYEVWYNLTNRDYFFQKTAELGIDARGVPVTIIGDKHWIGYASSLDSSIIAQVEKCIKENECHESSTTKNDYLINIPLIGEMDLSNTSLIFVTLLLGFMDGANPCSLWMITFLLGIIIYTGSRKKVAIIGLTFLLTITVVYGIFMIGLINVLYYVGFMFWIRLIVGLMALIFAIVNIKDYFWYKKGLSFTIPEDSKPGLFKKIRGIMNPENSFKGIIAGTIFLALSVTLIELPCTAGLPMLWTSIMAKNNVVGAEFMLHLAVYLLMFLIDESAIIIISSYTLKVSKFEEKHGRILKLFGGIIMLILGLSMIFMPKIMDEFSNMILIFLGAIIATALINYFYIKFKKKKSGKKIKERR